MAFRGAQVQALSAPPPSGGVFSVNSSAFWANGDTGAPASFLTFIDIFRQTEDSELRRR
ncbi:hypothetical protein SBV1_370103 [Verrucomicrobia bacterium]|nr:hypothetical protein SBV1_370103 [Verrucomicrobiota bacterium]